MVFLGRDMGEQRNYSEAVAKQIDDEVSEIMNNALKRAVTVLTENRSYLDKIADALVAKETLEQDEFNELVKEILPADKHLPGIDIVPEQNSDQI
jgi:cell division protease FtsH